MSLFLSWGKNFGLLTDIMIDYFPLYDKFRAVSSIQVVLELCVPIMGVLALRQLFKSSIAQSEKLKALKLTFFIILGFGIALFAFKGMFDFIGPSDDYLKKNYGDELVSLIQADRRAVYNNDLFRSLIFVFLAVIALWFLYQRQAERESYYYYYWRTNRI